MRTIRWLLPLFMLILGSLACFATADEDDDSSVPMASDEQYKNSSSGGMTLPTFTPSATYDGPPPTPFPTTDPAQAKAFDMSSDDDKDGGISAIIPVVCVMVLAFGLFVGVIWQQGQRDKTGKGRGQA